MKNFTAKEQIFLLDIIIMVGNLWLFLDRTSLLIMKQAVRWHHKKILHLTPLGNGNNGFIDTHIFNNGKQGFDAIFLKIAEKEVDNIIRQIGLIRLQNPKIAINLKYRLVQKDRDSKIWLYLRLMGFKTSVCKLRLIILRQKYPIAFQIIQFTMHFYHTSK